MESDRSDLGEYHCWAVGDIRFTAADFRQLESLIADALEEKCTKG